MPHQRQRTLTQSILKRLKLWPALGILGARQTGKSTLLREILPPFAELEYFTMDSANAKSRAEKSPESFAEPSNHKTKIIDEVQKVPALFDAIKLHIDQKRRPATYILSGSTQFSDKSGIREALTGRIGLLYLYPFSLSEIHSKPLGQYFLKKGQYKTQIKLEEFNRKIEKGGMPGFFHLHAQHEYDSTAQLWVETTCYRDLGKVLKKNFDGDLALSIFTTLAQVASPTAKDVADHLEIDPRIAKRYLDGFCEILVLKKLSPHAKSIGQHHYLFIDSGICTYLGGSRALALRCHVMIEALSLFESQGLNRPQVEYYHSTKRSYVPLLFSWKNEKRLIAVQISDRESPTLGEVKSLESFSQKLDIPVRSILLSQASTSYVEKGIEFHPLRG